jgi:uncharacterized integral membrane protein
MFHCRLPGIFFSVTETVKCVLFLTIIASKNWIIIISIIIIIIIIIIIVVDVVTVTVVRKSFPSL